MRRARTWGRLTATAWAPPLPRVSPYSISPRPFFSSSTSASDHDATIFGLSSAPGRAGLAVIRVSGPAARDVVHRLTPALRQQVEKPLVASTVASSSSPSPRLLLRHRQAFPTSFACPETGEVLDRGILLWFDAPRSFTGEDVAELHVHGSTAVTRATLGALSRMPSTRLAEPGEFTRRAFRNGKMDLTQAEGLADLLHAETEAQRVQALRVSGGSLRRRYDQWRAALLRAAAHVEAVLDFGEDEAIADEVFDAVVPDVAVLRDELKVRLASPPRGELVRAGVRVALVGAPNAGKSSLLNVLAGRDAAIVSDVPGTTRDAVEVPLDLGGYKVVVTDTAGVRPTRDPVELEGIRRSEQHARSADLTVLVLDASERTSARTAPALPDWAAGTSQTSPGTHLTVMNKMDLVRDASDAAVEGSPLRVSCVTKQGMDEFIAALLSAVKTIISSGDDAGREHEIFAITRMRHRERLEECVRHLDNFEAAAAASGPTGSSVALSFSSASSTGAGHEIAAEELRLAARALGHVTGHVDVEELLDVIFADFCIGK